MKNRMLLGILVFALAAALVGGATMAWFTDAAKTETVDFQAGTLMIDVDDPVLQDNQREHFDINRLNPGDCWEYKFGVDNVGTKSANWLLYMCWQDVVGRDNNKLPEGQQELLQNKAGYGTNGLSEVLEWTFLVDGVEVTTEPVKLAAGSPLVINMAPFAAGPGTKTVTARACLPGLETGNEYQGARMDAYFGVKAWQTTNSAPGFGPGDIECDFDNGEDPPPVDPPAREYTFGASLSGAWYGTGSTVAAGRITHLRDADDNIVSGPVDVTIRLIENAGVPVDLAPVTRTLQFDLEGDCTVQEWDKYTFPIEYFQQPFTYEVTIGDTTIIFRHGYHT